MKFSATSGELQKCLSNIGGVVPSKSTLPILENFLFEVKGDTLKITATDLEIAMTQTVKVKSTEGGRIAVPAKKLMDTVRALPLTEVSFEAKEAEGKIKMSTDSGEYRLTCEKSEEYPEMPEFSAKEELTLPSETLKRLITKTSFSASLDELRPAMMGIFFQIGKKELRAVATDGHRLVRVINSGYSGNVNREIILPAKAMNLAVKFLDGAECAISFSETHARFSVGETTLVSRIIEEKYPNYESVLPLDNDKKLTVGRNQLLDSVRRTSLYASVTTHQVRFSLKKNSLTVSAEDIDFGADAKETLKCEYTSDAMEIGFNSAYVIDILAHLDSDEVEFMLSSSSRAAIVKASEQKKDEDILMLVMPVRLNG
jgi:DNA polymerase-3 subunit beta